MAVGEFVAILCIYSVLGIIFAELSLVILSFRFTADSRGGSRAIWLSVIWPITTVVLVLYVVYRAIMWLWGNFKWTWLEKE